MRVVYSNYQEQLLADLASRIAHARAPGHHHIVFLPSEALRQLYREQLTPILRSTLDLDLLLIDEVPVICAEMGLLEAPQPRLIRSKDYERVLVEELSDYRRLVTEAEEKLLSERIPDLLLHSPLIEELRTLKGSLWPLVKKLAETFMHYSQQATDPSILERRSDWQALLWHRIRERLKPSVCYVELFEQLSKRSLEFDAPGFHWYFAGFAHLPQAVLRWVSALDSRYPVEWFFLSPSRLLWSDLSGFFANQRQLEQVAKAYPSSFAQLEELLLERHPLLANMAQLARPLAQFLEAQQGWERYLLPTDPRPYPSYAQLWWQELACQQQPASLLRILQLDLLLMRSSYASERVELKPDLSLVVHAAEDSDCEVRLLHGLILRKLHEDPGLRLSDLLILCPDIGRYRRAIERHFETCGLDYRIYDAQPQRVQGILSTLVQLLRFATGSWNWLEYRALLQLDLLARRWQGGELLRWFDQACKISSVHWGVDSEHQQQVAPELGLDKGTRARSWRDFWDQQIELLLKGDPSDYLQCGKPWDRASYSWGSRALATAIELHEKLQMLLEPWYRRHSLSLHEWAVRLDQIVEQLLAPCDDQGELAILEQVLNSLQRERTSCVDSQTASDLIIEQLEQLRTPWLGSSEGCLRFASLEPMRSLPVKHLFILGLGEQLAKGEPSRASFEWGRDLGVEPAPTRFQLDRHSFLEAIVSSRESLHLLYSASGNEPPQPCYLLSEFLSYLDHAFQIGEGRFSDCLHLQHRWRGHNWDGERYAQWPYQQLLALDRSTLSPSTDSSPAPSELLSFRPTLSAVASVTRPLQLYQLNWLMRDPLRFYLSQRLSSLRGFDRPSRPKPFELAASYPLSQQWVDWANGWGISEEMLQRIRAQAPSELSVEVWRQKLEQLSLERSPGGSARFARLSEGLMEQPSCSIERDLSAAAVPLGSHPWLLLGELGWIECREPHLTITGSGAKAREQLQRSLPPYLIAYRLGWLDRKELTIYSSKTTPKRVDLSQIDIEGWLECAGVAAEFFSQRICLFHPSLQSFLVEGTPLAYAHELAIGSQGSGERTWQRLELFLESMGFRPRKPEALQQAQEWLEMIQSYLRPLWDPLFEIYPLRAAKGGAADGL